MMGINQDGCEKVFEMARDPKMVINDLNEQIYLPGITVPGIPKLERPFYFPVHSDETSPAISISSSPEPEGFDTVHLAFELTDMPISPIDPNADGAWRKIGIEREIDGLLESQLPDWGGVFCAEVEVSFLSNTVGTGSAAILTTETREEWLQIDELLWTGRITPLDIFALARLSEAQYLHRGLQLRAPDS